MALEKIKPVGGVDRIINLLFVDDDPNFLEATRRLLGRLGYIITTAYSSREAIDILKEYHDVFDVVITDYDMPGMNGVELASAASEFLTSTPIILFTGRIDIKKDLIINQAGMAAIVNKPCKIKELDILIKDILDMNDEAPL